MGWREVAGLGAGPRAVLMGWAADPKEPHGRVVLMHVGVLITSAFPQTRFHVGCCRSRTLPTRGGGKDLNVRLIAADRRNAGMTMDC